MMQRLVTSVDRTEWNGQTQINTLTGVDENREAFSVSNSQASRQIRMEQFEYYLWDGNKKFIQLMSVANYVEAMDEDDELNLFSL